MYYQQDNTICIDKIYSDTLITDLCYSKCQFHNGYILVFNKEQICVPFISRRLRMRIVSTCTILPKSTIHHAIVSLIVCVQHSGNINGTCQDCLIDRKWNKTVVSSMYLRVYSILGTHNFINNII